MRRIPPIAPRRLLVLAAGAWILAAPQLLFAETPSTEKREAKSAGDYAPPFRYLDEGDRFRVAVSPFMHLAARGMRSIESTVALPELCDRPSAPYIRIGNAADRGLNPCVDGNAQGPAIGIWYLLSRGADVGIEVMPGIYSPSGIGVLITAQANLHLSSDLFAPTAGATLSLLAGTARVHFAFGVRLNPWGTLVLDSARLEIMSLYFSIISNPDQGRLGTFIAIQPLVVSVTM